MIVVGLTLTFLAKSVFVESEKIPDTWYMVPRMNIHGGESGHWRGAQIHGGLASQQASFEGQHWGESTRMSLPKIQEPL